MQRGRIGLLVVIVVRHRVLAMQLVLTLQRAPGVLQDDSDAIQRDGAAGPGVREGP
jgi:hypothetical protein